MLRVKTENETTLVDPSREMLAESLRALAHPDNRFLIYERTSGPDSFAQTWLRPQGGYWLDDRQGSAANHYTTVSETFETTLDALSAWAVDLPHWREKFTWEHVYPVPERVPIAYEPEFRTTLIGSYDDGLFLAGFCRVTYLHLFDSDGRHLTSDIALAEQAPGADADDLMEYLETVVAKLPGVKLESIAIRPFRFEHEGTTWGLVDETEDRSSPHAELRPDFLGFYPPWDGTYDT